MMQLTPLHTSGAVEWDSRLLPITDYAGRTFKRWVRVGMPKLGENQYLLDIVFYLYQTRDDAEKGKNQGGTGFLVSIPSDRWPSSFHHTYGVTNWHNACQSGASVIRVNRINGEPDIVELDPSEWSFIAGPKGYDIAAVDLTGIIKSGEHKVEALGPSFLLSAEEISHHEVGPADDVFMVGRFVDFDGVEVNKPALRFGHISIAEANVEQANGCFRPSHVVDMHSRTGFSGSPVFVYRTLGSIFTTEAAPFVAGGSFLRLLGIHWGQFPEQWEIKQGDQSSLKRDTSLVTEGAYVQGLSGMTLVCPSSAILEVLNMPKLKQQREQREVELANAGYGCGLPIAESANPSKDDLSTHREDFTSLLNAAARTHPQGD